MKSLQKSIIVLLAVFVAVNCVYALTDITSSSEVLVNPSTAIEPASGWTLSTLAASNSDVLDKINFRSYFMTAGETYTIDELRVGTTYESVVPTLRGTLILIH